MHDTMFAEFLKINFQVHADEFIAPKFLPNKIHNGVHHPELYLFDKSNVEYVRNIQRPISGGSIDNNFT